MTEKLFAYQVILYIGKNSNAQVELFPLPLFYLTTETISNVNIGKKMENACFSLHRNKGLSLFIRFFTKLRELFLD